MSDEGKSNMTIAMVMIIILAIIMIGKGLYASAIYGDWACAFSNCVKVTHER